MVTAENYASFMVQLYIKHKVIYRYHPGPDTVSWEVSKRNFSDYSRHKPAICYLAVSVHLEMYSQYLFSHLEMYSKYLFFHQFLFFQELNTHDCLFQCFCQTVRLHYQMKNWLLWCKTTKWQHNSSFVL